MKRAKRFSAGFIFLGLMFLAFQSSAFAADTDKCTAITAIPATINVSGVYCLTADLATNVSAGFIITINTDDVVLDLGGHTLGGLPAGPSTQAWAVVSFDHRNITIQNGTIRSFCRGIALLDSGSGSSHGHLVQNLQVAGSKCVAISVFGSGSIVRNNQVVDTNGLLGLANISGIYVGGAGVQVLNNLVENITVPGTANSYAIRIDVTGIGVVVENNQVSNPSLPISKFKGSIGIEADGSDVLVVNNRITTMDYGIFFGGAGKFRDNLTSSVTTPFLGGTDAGNNN